LHSFFFSPGGQVLVKGVGLLAFVGVGLAVSVGRACADSVGLAARDVACTVGLGSAVCVLGDIAGGPATLFGFPPDRRIPPTTTADTITAQARRPIVWTNDNSLTRLARSRGLQPSARECRPPMTSSVARIFPSNATGSGPTPMRDGPSTDSHGLHSPIRRSVPPLALNVVARNAANTATELRPLAKKQKLTHLDFPRPLGRPIRRGRR
jgi:hypothetical protein